jgi:hypothetical protein
MKNINLNILSIQDAAKYYSFIGIVTHPLNGKKPILKEWPTLIETPFGKIKPDNDLGFICGKVSDLTGIDIDWYVKGIWDELLKDVDVSSWVKQSHTEEKWHWLFRYCKELKAGQYQALGFDILSDSQIINKSNDESHTAGNNCVAAPSMHADGNKYQIFGDIENRPEVPEIVIKQINNLLSVFEDLTKTVIPKCRDAFEKLWNAVFIEKKNELYHDFPIFSDRNRLLHLMAELKSNGASNIQLHLVCMLIFGDAYDARKSEEEIKQINSGKTATTESIVSDPILIQFHKERDKVSKDKTIEDIEEEIDPLDIDYDEQGISPEMLEAAEREAEEILKNGDPLQYELDTISRAHTGDNNAEEAICISIAGQSCSNTNGIQPSLCGPSSSGKSHAMKSNLHLVPRRFKRIGSLSGKAAYYHKLRPGMIVFSDDTKLSLEMEDTIKRATTNYQEYTLHLSVSDQKGIDLFIPPRINWLFTHVDPQDSEQILNRQVVYETSSDEEQKKAIFEHQGDEAVTGETILDVDFRVLVCRRINAKIKELEPVKVVIPYAKQIRLADINNSRIFPMFLDMIRGYTIFMYQQREKDPNGNLIATEEDFWRAKRLFESRAENTVTHLTAKEKAIVEYIINHQESRGCTANEIATGTGIDPKTIYSLIAGRSDRPDTGLIYKVKGMIKEPIPNENGGRPTNVFKIEGFESWQFVDGFVSLATECGC